MSKRFAEEMSKAARRKHCKYLVAVRDNNKKTSIFEFKSERKQKEFAEEARLYGLEIMISIRK